MIPMGTTKEYQFAERKSKYGYSFNYSPKMLITDDIRKMLETFFTGQTLTLQSKVAGTEAEYEIVDINLYLSQIYPDGLLEISVKRVSQDMIVNPDGNYEKDRREKMGWTYAGLPNIKDLTTIQPMTQPGGQVFYLDFKYGDDKKTDDKSKLDVNRNLPMHYNI
jgi:hypothetical protein